MTTVQTHSAAVEYSGYGIRVNAVSPSAVRTEMMLGVFGSGGALDQMGTFHPMGRIGPRKKLPTRLHGCSRRNHRITPVGVFFMVATLRCGGP
jgi:NAD(P)-dependent dehydrogenase (short-subunit alcohol dehydrogenase family)